MRPGGQAQKICAAFALLMILAGCGGQLSSLPELPASDEGPYRLGAGDQLRLQVFGQEELSQEYIVSDSGAITVPLIGAVEAEGKTVAELEQEIARQLSDGILVNPNVSAEVMTYRPFFVLGETRSPGQYPYVPDMTVMTAVSMAGGFTFRAETDAVSITRVVDGQTAEFRADPLDLVEPGDVVNVHERFF